jgi:hypothetical protein
MSKPNTRLLLLKPLIRLPKITNVFPTLNLDKMKNFDFNCLNWLFFLILLNACSSMKNLNYNYFDGSGNRYVIQKDQIEYIPIQPAQSSSGTYSGGEPAQKTLKPEDYQKLVDEFTKIFANQGIQIKDRIKTSGLLKQGEKKSVIFKDGSEKQQLEVLLKQLLQ